MKIYLANIDASVLPERAWALITQRGYEVAGNWAAAPHHRSLADYAPDVIVYAPHRQKEDLSWRDAALTVPRELLRRVPVVLWALYPDYLTGWDHSKNEHGNDFLDAVHQILPFARATLTNSRFSKQLLEERGSGFTFEVCYLGIDTKAIDEARGKSQRSHKRRSVLWQHRWATDKNLPEAMEIMLDLAAKHPDVTFYLGRKENWDEEVWVPEWLRELYTVRARQFAVLKNFHYSPYFDRQVDYWRFLCEIDLAFSCSYHETFGISMLEQAYAGAACVVPYRAAYPEVHPGALIVAPEEIGRAVECLLEDGDRCGQVAASSHANAALYTVERTVESLLSVVERVGSEART